MGYNPTIKDERYYDLLKECEGLVSANHNRLLLMPHPRGDKKTANQSLLDYANYMMKVSGVNGLENLKYALLSGLREDVILGSKNG